VAAILGRLAALYGITSSCSILAFPLSVNLTSLASASCYLKLVTMLHQHTKQLSSQPK